MNDKTTTAARVGELLRERLGPALLELSQPQSDTVLARIDKQAVRAASTALVGELAARFLINAGIDRRETAGDFSVAQLFSLDRDHLFVVLDCAVDPAEAAIDSITAIVPGAGWAEREFRDAVGVEPRDHPDPRRLILPDDWPADQYPLRRDFRYDERPPAAQGLRPPEIEPPAGTSVISVGPFYPVLEEPAHWRLFVEGETVVGCDYRGFYNHRGIEKLGDSELTYNEIPYVAERICGICGFIHSTCYCQAVEEAAGIEVPRRARFLRTIMLEIERIHSHLLWLGIAGHILGFDTVLMQTWRIREPVMWLAEAISGNRKTYGMNTIGGVRRDIAPELEPRIREVLDTLEREVAAVRDAIAGDATLMARARGVGVLTADKARELCVVGPPARGSGLGIDARVDHPYAAYDEVPVQIAVEQEGDTWARVLVRVDEILEAIRLAREALAALPPGPVLAEVSEEIPPDRVGISVVEAPRGEAVHAVWTGGDHRPYRWRVRAPTYPNLQAVPAMIADNTIADVPITIGSLDPCFSCTERFEAVDLRTSEVRVYTQRDLIEMSQALTRGRKP